MSKIELDTIIIIPCCGFANRLKFIASVDIIARKLKCKNVKVMWNTTTDCNITVESLFNKLGNMEFISELPPKDELLYYGHVHLDDIINKLKHEPNMRSKLVVEGGHEHKYDMTDVEFFKQKSKFYNSIIWSDYIYKLLGDYTAVGVPLPPVGVHYRHPVKETDEADINANPLINFAINSPFSEFEKLIKKCKSKCFFISNSLYHKTYINDNYSKKVTVINLIENNDRSNDESMLNSVVEFIILSRCDVIIGTYYSSFSDEASYFKMIPKILPINELILDKKELCIQFMDKYHSTSKPVKVDNYLLMNPNYKELITHF